MICDVLSTVRRFLNDKSKSAVDVMPEKFKRGQGVHSHVSPWNGRPQPFHGRFKAVPRP